MARLPDVRYIKTDDFDKEQREVIDRIAFPVNSFMEQTRQALDGNLDFTNLNQEIVQVTVSVSATGIPIQKTQFKSNLNTKLAGLMCINAINTTSQQVYPTNQPFVSFTQNETTVTINYISGLQVNNKYVLTLLTLGQ